MAVRPTMTPLIDRLRLWIADPSGAASALPDAVLQAALDDNRTDVYDQRLTRAGVGVYRAEVGWWETATLTAGTTPVEAETVDLMRGVWTFTTDPGVVKVTGSWYDGHAAAADALTQLVAGMRSGQVTRWSDGQVTVQRTDATQDLMALIRDHRSRSHRPGGRVRSVRVHRSDQVPAA